MEKKSTINESSAVTGASASTTQPGNGTPPAAANAAAPTSTPTSTPTPSTDLQLNPSQPQQSGLTIEQVSIDRIDALTNAKVVPIDLTATYWSPEIPGETKRVLFDYIGESEVLAQDGSGEVIPLETAYFLTKEEGVVKRIANASKRLVGSIQSLNLKQYAALEIKYLGKKQNRSNAFKSDSWSIFPLQIQL